MNVKRRKLSVTFLCHAGNLPKKRQELKHNLQEIVIGQYNVKNILEYGKSERGKKYLFYFLKRTGLEG